jgi:hypothetical protein
MILIYCCNAEDLPDKNPNPAEQDTKKALDPIRRQGGAYLPVIRAIKWAAGSVRV